MGLQAIDSRAIQLLERADRRNRQQPLRGCRRAGVELSLRGGHCALAADPWAGCQLGSPLQKRCGRLRARACLRARRAALELDCHGLIRSGGCACTVPGPPIGVGLRIGGVGERGVTAAARLGRSGSVGRRAHERVPKAHTRTQLDQPRVLSRDHGVGSDAEFVQRAQQQSHVAHGLRSRNEQQLPRLVGKRFDAPQEALFDAARQRLRIGKPEPAGHLGRRQATR